MGGVAGHMDHLYDDRDLTFTGMKEILSAASEGNLSYEEKVDGQNIFLSYDLSATPPRAVAARNIGNIKKGGMDAAALANKFAGRGGLTEAFTGAFKTFEKAVEALSSSQKKQIFGEAANIWYNSEVMSPSSPNVIQYDAKNLKIHDSGHKVKNPETGRPEPADVSDSLSVLDDNLKSMQNRLSKDDFNFVRSAVIELQGLESGQFLEETKRKIDAVISQEGLDSNSTVLDYLKARIRNSQPIETLPVPDKIKDDITARALKLEGAADLRAIKQGVSKDVLDEIKAVTDRVATAMLLKKAIEPLEMIIHDFAVEMLKAVQSLFVANPQDEVRRLQQTVKNTTTEITRLATDGVLSAQDMDKMRRELNKIKEVDRITSSIEGVVFDYNGRTYKFTGQFAPINQILGILTYGKQREAAGQRDITNEAILSNKDLDLLIEEVSTPKVLTEKEGKRVALIPGGFKPPHAGHFQLAKYFADKKDVDEVYVIVSTKERPPVTVDMSVKLWELYTKDMPNVKIMAGTTPSPVGDVYELIADNAVFKEGDTALLGKSEKDADDARFDRAQSYAERNNPGVKVEPVITPLFAGGVSGTQMRQYLVQGEEGEKEFKKNLPRKLSAEEKDQAYEIVTTINDNINRPLDDMIDEISSMAGGAVAGYAGGFGPPNKFNPYRRTKKPKVKRAKRQRRR